MYRSICVLLLLPSLVGAQGSSALPQWEAVEKVAVGERIEVQLMDYKTLTGSPCDG